MVSIDFIPSTLPYIFLSLVGTLLAKERFKSIASSYYRGANGFIILYR